MHESDTPGPQPLPQLALLAAIVDSSFDGIVSKTLDGTITSWNAAAARLFGYTADEAIGRQIAMLVPPDRLEEEAWILGRLRAGGRVENFETVRLHKDGHPIAVAVTSSPVRNAAGEIVGASKLVRDVSAQRAAASALAESEARMAAIVESAMDAIISVDEQGLIVVFNEAAVEMLRCPREQAVGCSLDRFVPPRQRPTQASWMADFGAGGLARRTMGSPGRIDACRADGSSFPAEASIAHVQVLGQPLYTVILRDVSELRQAQSARRTLEAQLREAQKMEAVGTLAGGIAHDVNNALGSILANAALAREDLAPDHPARLSVDQVEVAAQRARAVVRQILAFSRRQTQELLVQPLAPLVSEALALLRSTLPSVVRLEAQLSDPGLHVRADANQVHQVLLNLCTNAWHALRGSTGRIRVGVERVAIDALRAQALDAIQPGPYARLWVADDGCGMDAATRARIFEPFFTTKPRGEGTGLGLAVVHGIVHAHGGAIEVRSTPGAGTLFDIYLPEVPAAEGTRAPAGDPADSAPVGGGWRVAYVDDDETMLLVVERLLRRRGFEVACYADPRALLARLQDEPAGVDIVVSDFNMPAMNGVDLARALAGLGLPVIVSSGYLSEELRESARAAGVCALLEKEDTLERLAPLVASVLARRERDDAAPDDPPEP